MVKLYYYTPSAHHATYQDIMKSTLHINVIQHILSICAYSRVVRVGFLLLLLLSTPMYSHCYDIKRSIRYDSSIIIYVRQLWKVERKNEYFKQLLFVV